jgi:hypothetical protein
MKWYEEAAPISEQAWRNLKVKKPKEVTISSNERPILPEDKPVVTVQTLRDVRENAIRQRSDHNRMIAELTELAAEISSTLAFLKAQRGD